MGPPSNVKTSLSPFLASIISSPHDPLPRLILADYLEERGDPNAEIIRLLCEVQRPGSGTCPECRGRGSVDCPDCLGEDRPCDTCLLSGQQTCRECQGQGRLTSPAYTRLEAVTGGLDAVIERLSGRDRRLFACDCAERVLPLFEREYPGGTCSKCGGDGRSQEYGRISCRYCDGTGSIPGDDRPRRAVETARRYARGEATKGELERCRERVSGLGPKNPWWRLCYCLHFGARITDPAELFASAAADPAAERRWQLCRAVEYLLGFVETTIPETS